MASKNREGSLHVDGVNKGFFESQLEIELTSWYLIAIIRYFFRLRVENLNKNSVYSQQAFAWPFV